MPKGASVGGGLSIQQMKDAFLLALTEAGDGGGGSGSSVPNPDAIITGTGGYTIPVGFVAKVKANCRNGETFSVNGATVLSSGAKEISRILVYLGNVGQAAHYYVPSGYKGFVQFGIRTETSHHNAVRIWIDNVSFGPATAIERYYDRIFIGASGTHLYLIDNYPQISGYAERGNNTSVTQEFNLKEGSTISGGRYTVELYAI